ncbi:MAG: 6-carboxytetrahydropterin synthase [Bryobacterales bacterium]|nr:6-carboxytetrahydropterin synthase [Acidobacteriota bacterium]MCB9385828.1 6-carboxytetrahydropterin synthase [Bryobacterales bacterium]
MLRLTRCYPFCASHRLHLDSLSEEENQELFGKCNNPYGHGHNYRLHVTLSGQADPETGMLVDRDALDRVVREDVLKRIDHKDMNSAVPEFADLNPTTENLAKVISGWLCRAWSERGSGAKLQRLTLEETARNTFTLEMESLHGPEDR